MSGLEILDVVAEVLLFFTSSIYLGVFWGLHFFWFPGWQDLTVDNFRPQFFGPIDKARTFFTVVVSMMYLVIIILLVLDWNTVYRWFDIASFVLLSASFYVGNWIVFPINNRLRLPDVTQALLTADLKRWMMFNDIRTVIITVMWLELMWYLLLKRFGCGG